MNSQYNYYKSFVEELHESLMDKVKVKDDILVELDNQ